MALAAVTVSQPLVLAAWELETVWAVFGAIIALALALVVLGIVLEAGDRASGGLGAGAHAPLRSSLPCARRTALLAAFAAVNLALSITALIDSSSLGAPSAVIRALPSGGRGMEAAMVAGGAGTSVGGSALAAVVRLGSGSGSASAARAAAAARLPPLQAGRVVRLTVTAQERIISIAPGIRYRAWTFDGQVPGPVIHVRVGQRLLITFRNLTSMAHSLDLHAAEAPANVAFKDVLPGGSETISFVARRAGAFLYHCVTAPALMHIANGMYGALIVDPTQPLPTVSRAYVLVASEWYLDGRGVRTPAALDWDKALAVQPDLVTFNGYADLYDEHPLRVGANQRVRLYVVDAGPNLVTPFHLVGGVFDRVYPDADPRHWLTGVQTSDVPAGGGLVFDARFGGRGVWGFVGHAFANVAKGEIGAIDVGGARGTMTH